MGFNKNNGNTKQKVEDLNPLENASAGFLAAFFSSLTLCPTELVKCKLQALQETQFVNINEPKVKAIHLEIPKRKASLIEH